MPKNYPNLTIFLALVFILFTQVSEAQNKLDSLWSVWEDPNQPDSNRLMALKEFTWGGYLFTQPDSAFYFAELQYEFAKSKDLKKYMAEALNTQGVSYGIRGNSPKALEYFQKSLPIREELGDQKGMANTNNNIGMIYRNQGDNTMAREYFQKGLAIVQELGNKKVIANTLNNIGLTYQDQGDFDKALEYFENSLVMQEELGNRQSIAVLLNNIGSISEKQNKYPKAMEYFQKSLKMRKELGDYQGVANSLNNIGILYKEEQEYSKAIKYCSEGLEMAKNMEVLNEQKNACKCLYHAYKETGNNTRALGYFEQMTLLKDSLFNEENTKKITQLEMQYEFDKKEAATKAEQEKKDAIAAQELKQQKLVRNGFMGGFAVVFLFAGVFLVQRNRIGKEKERSEELLLNILPEETAQELKEKGHADAQLIEQVTVLFTDFKGFTALSEKVTPKELVADLHECFSAFDHICEKYGIEKIKTIGDAYMAAGGLPSPNFTHAKDVVNAALEMAKIVEKGKAKKIAAGLPFFEIRIGVHTGPVVAGIVGVKKFQYDIWGDTVNTASRMESSGEVGKVNISESTFELLKQDAAFSFESRGKVKAKGKGEIEMFFVDGKPS
ncbi:MAG: adenylate/guanylate cyclase domain-containing protein [Saprospiraceae bacterium]